ncbi:hypothetical protein [Streptomyces sp. VNUA24]|uniref:hypothetical protein n=1 Tax=Streptomyces sp. VNUA24 TaxID=3031131 RepID=UPI0023B82E68|nr:hypothetical protein [Streptomyces sp. VNUA24]WEH15014.1 hypothetical protein PYR72_15290 [Streptomyces sp. VNUA24]
MAANTTAAKTTAEPVACTCSQFATADGQTTGCTAETKRLFAPGHDAKLKSFLIKVGAEGTEVIRTVDGIASSADASTHAAKFAFGHMVAAGITRAEGKAAEKAERAAARAARKAAPKAPKKVTAKVGRATFTGHMDGDHFVYEVKGKERRTLKFTAV